MDLFTTIVMEEHEGEMNSNITKSNKFLRDTAFNLLATGRDTVSSGLTWLFWLVATHPLVEAKILEEIKEHLLDNGKLKDLNIDELSKLVYPTERYANPYAFFHLYLSIKKLHCNLIFFLAVTLSSQVQKWFSLYTQWEGWKAYGVKIAWNSSQRDGFQSMEE